MVEDKLAPLEPHALLSLRGITKRYAQTLANDHVSLSVRESEVLGVLGENGAGKSTLMHILSGLIAPDAGEIVLRGRPVRFKSPREAVRAGIGMVHQHFMLVGALSVAENLALGDERWGKTVLDYVALRAAVEPLAREIGMPMELDARIDELPVGRQQQVEILKALLRNPSVLILDEPTAVLPPEERAGLLRRVRALKAQGRAIILISHKLEDILECCDRVVVMRQGRVVGDASVAGLKRADLVRLVVGGDIPPVERRDNAETAEARRVALSVEALTLDRMHGASGAKALDNVSFELHAGEILGVCGVDGNGQSELVQVLAGMLRYTHGRVVYHFDEGAECDRVGPCSVHELRRSGLAHIAEDRLRHAVLASFDLAANWLFTNLHRATINRYGWLRPAAALAEAQSATARYAIKVPSFRANIEQLSGGNQQKFVLARELACAPRIVLAAHPTRGLDLATTARVKQELLRARERGAAVLLLSADLAEVCEIADRVMVMAGGHVRGPVAVSDTSIQALGSWMTGH